MFQGNRHREVPYFPRLSVGKCKRKNAKPSNSAVRKSYIAVTETLNDFQCDVRSWLLTSSVRNEKQNYHIQAPWINQTLTPIKQEVLFGRSVMCNCRDSVSPRKQGMRENKLNSTNVVPPAQDRKQTKAVVLKWKSHIRN